MMSAAEWEGSTEVTSNADRLPAPVDVELGPIDDALVVAAVDHDESPLVVGLLHVD